MNNNYKTENYRTDKDYVANEFYADDKTIYFVEVFVDETTDNEDSAVERMRQVLKSYTDKGLKAIVYPAGLLTFQKVCADSDNSTWIHVIMHIKTDWDGDMINRLAGKLNAELGAFGFRRLITFAKISSRIQIISLDDYGKVTDQVEYPQYCFVESNLGARKYD